MKDSKDCLESIGVVEDILTYNVFYVSCKTTITNITE